MSLRDTLIATRALVDTPDKWTKHHMARNSEGWIVPPNDKSATCFCLLGAISAATREWDEQDNAAIHLRAILKNSVSGFNDRPDTTHAMILELIDKAIAQCVTP